MKGLLEKAVFFVFHFVLSDGQFKPFISIRPIFYLDQPDGNLIPPPPDDLSSGCQVENPIHRPDTFEEIGINNIDGTTGYVSEAIEGLYKGKRVVDYIDDYYSYFRGYRQFCDFLTNSKSVDGDVVYVPAMCVPSKDCKKTGPRLSEYGNMACKKLANRMVDLNVRGVTRADAKTYVCCPINGTDLWKTFIEPHRDNYLVEGDDSHHIEFREIPTNFRLLDHSPYVKISGRNVDILPPSEKKALTSFLEKGLDELFENAVVCGFVKDHTSTTEVDGREVFVWYPFLCVKPSECGQAEKTGTHTTEPNPLWHQFCSDKFTPIEDNDRLKGDPKFIYGKEHSEATVCCHIYNMGEKYIKRSMGYYVPSLQLPNFFKFAPGLRSAYKCEEYSKAVCKKDTDGNNLCINEYNYPPKKGENPHMASLGVIRPKTIMFHCGGALISTRYVLSTDRCSHWWGYKVNAVMLGGHQNNIFESTNEKVHVIVETKHIPPQKYVGEPPVFTSHEFHTYQDIPDILSVDLALYKMEVEVEITRYIRPACLYHGQRTWARFPSFLGWGSEGSFRSDYLKQLRGLQLTHGCTSDYFPDEFENPYYNRYGAETHSWLACYKKDPKENLKNLPGGLELPCSIDMGGPLHENLVEPYCMKLLLGVLSSYGRCNQTERSVFINITQFLSAIEDEVWGKYVFIDLDLKSRKPSCSSTEGWFFF